MILVSIPTWHLFFRLRQHRKSKLPRNYSVLMISSFLRDDSFTSCPSRRRESLRRSVTLTGFYIDIARSLSLSLLFFASTYPSLLYSPTLPPSLSVSFFCELIMQKKNAAGGRTTYSWSAVFLFYTALSVTRSTDALYRSALSSRVFRTPRYPSSLSLYAERVKPCFVNYNHFVHVCAESVRFFLFVFLLVLLTPRNREFLRFLRVYFAINAKLSHADS